MSSTLSNEKQENFGQDRISMLVVEDNEYMLDILVNSLKRIGFTRVQKARNGREAVEYLKMTAKASTHGAVEPIDIVISDLVMSPVNGLQLLQWLRDDKASPNRFMPFIMLSAAADRQNVEEARDRGVNDFMGKPFAVENIYKVLQRIIDTPRQFVVTQAYFGPDRRRSSKLGPPRGMERRKPDESHATVVHSKDRIWLTAAPSEVWLFKLPNYLRLKMGMTNANRPFVLPEAVLASAEQHLKREAEGFPGWAKAYLDQLSKKVTLAKQLSGDRAVTFEETNIIAHELRGQGGTFGYPLITVFGKSLYEVTQSPCRQDDAGLEIVKAHIDAMRAVLREKITGDGGQVGKQLFQALKLEVARLSSNQVASAG
ncbi:MAG: response regulator [Rhodospirillaceae bacterium]|nr:MAG: response regulator [Rhodospirillaceae bacterium]